MTPQVSICAGGHSKTFKGKLIEAKRWLWWKRHNWCLPFDDEPDSK